MAIRKKVYIKYENLVEINSIDHTITVKIEDNNYTFNNKVSDINNSTIFIDGKEIPISELLLNPKLLKEKINPGFIKLDESIAVNSGLYHLVR